jgi:glucosyl-dolichyl phosphate glucuronosyltransferase
MSADLSVVVCTHNRPRDLARCLRALALLEDPAEVIVVDSASEPACRQAVEGGMGRLRPRYVREEEPGLSRARNRGIAEASGRIIAFLDDDTAPRPDWARHIVAAFDVDQAVGCVGGACVAAFDEDAHRPGWLSDRLLQFAGITMFGEDAREARSSAEWPFGANIAFRREALPGGAPFPEALGRHADTLLSGEEFALVEELRAAGWKIWLEPRAIVDHTVHSERCEAHYYWRRLWWAGVSRARATHAATSLAVRLLIAAPVRLSLYLLTGDRVHLFRTAETAGFLVERVRLFGNTT